MSYLSKRALASDLARVTAGLLILGVVYLFFVVAWIVVAVCLACWVVRWLVRWQRAYRRIRREQKAGHYRPRHAPPVSLRKSDDFLAEFFPSSSREGRWQ